jgi:hypothetical protein
MKTDRLTALRLYALAYEAWRDEATLRAFAALLPPPDAQTPVERNLDRLWSLAIKDTCIHTRALREALGLAQGGCIESDLREAARIIRG